MQQIISLDSTTLNSIQSCARKTQYQFIDLIAPSSKGEAIEKGDLVHRLLEIYYSLLGGCAKPSSETWKMLKEHFLIDTPTTPWPHDDSVNLAIKVSSFFASKLELPVEACEEVIKHFSEYVEHFRHDSWRPLSVEEVGSKVLCEDEDLKVIYNVKIDMVAEKGNMIAPFDHKSSRQRKRPNELSNQFRGYCWVLNSSHIVINKIGFQKTLSAADRFERHIITYSPDTLQEWVENSSWWARLYYYHLQSGHWPMNLTSCDKYSGCFYEPICVKDSDSRKWVIQRDFAKGKVWDVAKGLV